MEKKKTKSAPVKECSEFFRYIPELIESLEEIYPSAECALEHNGSPWRLLVMSILSAQCTDKRVNQVSGPLFEKYPTPREMADSPEGELEEYIKSCGLYRSKAKNIRLCCHMLCEKYNGEVPREMDELTELPGVGRKIANLIRGDVYGLPAIVADTHCIRLAERMGFTPEGTTDPLKTERALTSVIPPEKQSDFCHRLVWYGREWCTARAPKCEECPLIKLMKQKEERI